jgi:hypothetical protein
LAVIAITIPSSPGTNPRGHLYFAERGHYYFALT